MKLIDIFVMLSNITNWEGLKKLDEQLSKEMEDEKTRGNNETKEKQI